ncbi:SDR family NAD(P)-dependent oxidoreductase [Caldimonas thermodepolymerans]|jgi:NAD(P)-dependent dehydrogenase (short-subunit alcohol dehydrogenase family)|uniref:SDR family NAD(P)-dependent oxidoreductase n=1 Tax=Caldimonas thermodepolymerans TaxID=215580 RepID=UPI002235984E|nr:SDR family oxidoreductase [Caldimonas thermodepolymerans]UZG44401.1 SDR family oxidoreductase [Caldimonas thermodepolymerans]
MSNPTTSAIRTALVTGGGTGLGLALGLELKARGWQVLAIGMDTEPGLKDSGIEFERMDVTDEASLVALAARLPRLDLLANAAGIILHEGREHTSEGFRKVVDVNLVGTQLACYVFRDRLKVAGGSIINFASMWSYFGSGRNPGYSASKGAVMSLTKALAVAYAGDGIRVNAIAPGWIDTRMSVNAFSDPERAGPILQRLPAGRWGQPSEVAKAAAFLASEDASYITGVTLPVDGGYSIA